MYNGKLINQGHMMTLNTLTLSIENDHQPHAHLEGWIKGWDGETIIVAESGPLMRVKAAADYYKRSFENVKIEVAMLEE